jgi:hypothetical protein
MKSKNTLQELLQWHTKTTVIRSTWKRGKGLCFGGICEEINC